MIGNLESYNFNVDSPNYNIKINDITKSISNIFTTVGQTKELISENMKPLDSVNETVFKNSIINNQENISPNTPRVHRQITFELEDLEKNESLLNFKEIVSQFFMNNQGESKIEAIKKEAAAISAMSLAEEKERERKKKVEEYFTEMDFDIQQILRLMSLNAQKEKNKEKEIKLQKELEEKEKQDLKRKPKQIALSWSVASVSVIDNIVIDKTGKEEEEIEEEVVVEIAPVKLECKELEVKEEVESAPEIPEEIIPIVPEEDLKEKRRRLKLNLKEINKQYEEPVFTEEELIMLSNLESCNEEDRIRLKKKMLLFYKKRLLKKLSYEIEDVSFDESIKSEDPDLECAGIVKDYLFHKKSIEFIKDKIKRNKIFNQQVKRKVVAFQIKEKMKIESKVR